MSSNHFMKIREVAKETGIAEGLLYDWASKQKIAEKLSDDGVKLLSLDEVKEYRKTRRTYPERPASGRVLQMQVTGGDSNLLPGKVRRLSAANMANRAKLKKFAMKLIENGERPTPYGLMKAAHEAKLPAGLGTAAEILKALKQEEQAKPKSSKPAGKSPPYEGMTAMLLAWTRELKNKEVTDLQYRAGGSPEWTWKRLESGEL